LARTTSSQNECQGAPRGLSEIDHISLERRAPLRGEDGVKIASHEKL